MKLYVQQEARQFVVNGTNAAAYTFPPIFVDDNFRVEVTLLNPGVPVGLLAAPCTVDTTPGGVVRYGLVTQLTGTTATVWASGTGYYQASYGTYAGTLVVGSLGGLLGTNLTASPYFELETINGASQITVRSLCTVTGRSLR